MRSPCPRLRDRRTAGVVCWPWFVPSPDATLGDGDGAARHPYRPRRRSRSATIRPRTARHRKESCPDPVSEADYATVSEAGSTINSLRHGRPDNRRLQWALALSLMAHLLCWGGYELSQRMGWLEQLKKLSWLHHPAKPVPPVPPPAVTQEPELTFLQVAEADPVPPQKPKFYSNNNSHAANPDPDKNLDTPKLNGQQTDMVRTETAPRTKITKAPQATAEPAQQQTQSPPPSNAVKPGDTAQNKPQDAEPQPEPPHPPRPRTIKDALAQQPNQIQGREMRQEGGTHRIALRPSFDAQETAFGDYDAQFTQAVQQKWDDLLDSQRFADDRTGHVVLRFHQNYDGTITEITTLENTVGPLYGYLCMRALTEPAPYARWPEDMRRLIGGNFREMTFTFYYY